MKYWLFKSEPSTYSINHLQKDNCEFWDGIRNYQARNFMMNDMTVGDRIFFYHSSCPNPGIVGEATVAKLAEPDPTQFDPKSHYYDPKSSPDKPRWWCVSVAFVRQFPTILSLRAIREMPALADMLLLKRGNRLSITPVTKKDFMVIENYFLKL